MNNLKATFCGMIVLIMVLSVVIGCGDDDKGTDPIPPPSLNDPSYLAASLPLEAGNNSAEFAYLVTIIDFSKIKWGSEDAPVYHPASGFWYAEDYQIDTVYSEENPSVIINTTPITTIDSIRFWHGTTAVQNPDSALLTRIESGVYVYAVADSTDDTMTIEHDLNITGAPGEIWSNGDVTVSGNGTMVGTTSEDYYREPDEPSMESLGVCKVIFNLAASYPSLALNMSDVLFGCPTSGTITSTGPLNVEYCPGADENLEFPATWTSVMTFSGDNITIVTNSPTRQWTVTGTCGDM